MSHHTVLGQTEEVVLPDLHDKTVPARIDTGARTSAVWASYVDEKDGYLEVIFYDKGSEYHTGRIVRFDEFSETVVSSSNGHSELRYKVRLTVHIGGKHLHTWFTLADRSTQVYPILIGRNVLRGKFIVDVSLRLDSMRDAERKRTEELRRKLKESS